MEEITDARNIDSRLHDHSGCSRRGIQPAAVVVFGSHDRHLAGLVRWRASTLGRINVLDTEIGRMILSSIW